MTASRILVLMATLNGARWIEEQLDSIFVQEGPLSVSVLVSDDGSTDETLQLLEAARLKYDSLKCLPASKARLGACASFLRLLREAPLNDIDFVALSDQDDVWLPGRLSRAVCKLRASAASAYSSDAVAFWSDGRRRRLGKASRQRAIDYLFEPAGPGCTYVLSIDFARSLQAELRSDPTRFDGIGYHDWLIYCIARSRGLAWVIDPEPGVMYRQHDSNELGANFGTAGVQRRWGRLTSGWFREQLVRMASIEPLRHAEILRRLKRLSCADRLWFATRASRFRRRPRDQFALAVMLLAGVLR